MTATDQGPSQGAQDAEWDDLRNRLEEQRPETLRLESGQSFIGTYVRLEKGHTLEWGDKWIMVLASPTGELRSLWLLHTVLINELTKLKPKPGDRIGVKYLGKLKPQSGKGPSYHAWRVVSSAEAGQHAWGHVEGEATTEDEPATTSSVEQSQPAAATSAPLPSSVPEPSPSPATAGEAPPPVPDWAKQERERQAAAKAESQQAPAPAGTASRPSPFLGMEEFCTSQDLKLSTVWLKLRKADAGTFPPDFPALDNLEAVKALAGVHLELAQAYLLDQTAKAAS